MGSYAFRFAMVILGGVGAWISCWPFVAAAAISLVGDIGYQVQRLVEIEEAYVEAGDDGSA